MAELGAGGGSGYPAAIDTDGTQESGSTLTSFNLVNDMAAAVIAVQAELGTDPAQNLSTLKAFLAVDHDADGVPKLLVVEHSTAGKHTGKYSFMFEETDVAASQSAAAMKLAVSDTISEIEMPWAGSITGISVLSNASRSADTLTVDATVNGSVTGLQAVLDGTNADHHSAIQTIDTDSFSAGDRIGVKITTGGSWAPVTADIVVVVFVSFN